MKVQENNMAGQRYCIIAGAPRSGTTALYNYLAAHPQMTSSFLKQTNYFLNESLFAVGVDAEKVESDYAKYFPVDGDGYRLEASPDYIYSDVAAKHIYKSLKDRTKIIILIRNPVAQFESFYNHYKRLSRIDQNIDINNFIANAIFGDSTVGQELLEKGKVFSYLRCYLDVFGKNNVVFILSEDLSQKPTDTMNNLAVKLSIDTSFYSSYVFLSANTSSAVRSSYFLAVYKRLRKNILALMHLYPFFRRPFSPLISVSKRLYAVLNKTPSTANEISAKSRGQLQEYYKDDVRELGVLLGRDLNWLEE